MGVFRQANIDAGKKQIKGGQQALVIVFGGKILYMRINVSACFSHLS